MHRGITRLSRIRITQVMESESKVFGFHSVSHLNYGKIEHENGLTF